MKTIVYDDRERLVQWAADTIGIGNFRPDAQAIGMVEDGQIRAVTVYDCFSTSDMSMHCASDGTRRWLTREFLVRCFAYPFIQCDLNRVTGLIPANYTAALRFNRHLGFVQEGRCREAHGDGQDIIVMGMLRRFCKYLPKEYRK